MTRIVIVLILGIGAGAAAPSVDAQDTSLPDTLSPETTVSDTSGRSVRILAADTLRQTTRRGRAIRILRGDVALRQDTTRLYADRVEQYVRAEADSFLFEGNVRIVDQGDTLEAPRVRYYEGSRLGSATGGVRLTDGEVVLTAPAGTYDLDRRRARFRDGVRMVDSVTVLTSRAGVYWMEEKRAMFFGDVRLEQEDAVMEGDSLVHYRGEDRSHGFGSVRVEHREGIDETAEAAADTLRRTLLFGEEARYDRPTGRSVITGEPLLVQLRFDSTGVDTMMVRSNRLRAVESDTLRTVVAVGGVRFWERRLAAVADSVIYERWASGYRPRPASSLVVRADTSGQLTRMYRDPTAWMRENQISGDTLRLAGRGQSIDTLEVRTGAFVASRDTAIDRIHQLKGIDLHARLRGDELDYAWVGPQAEAIRYLSNERGDRDGAVQLSSDRIQAWFRADSLRRVNASSGVEGTYYDETVMPDTLQLEGFRWVPDRRPRKHRMLEEIPPEWRRHAFFSPDDT